MQKNNNIRLIDEALAQESIKNTFRLAWEFIFLNKIFTFSILSLLILLKFLNTFSAELTMIFSGIFSLAIQIYVARIFYETEDINRYSSQIKESTLFNIIKKHTWTASGVYTAWMVLLFIPIFITSFSITHILLFSNGLGEVELFFKLLFFIGMPLFTIILIFSYVYPLVQANIAMAKNYKEGFFAVFTLFSKSVWKRAFQKKYFKYTSLIGIVIFFSALVIGVILFIFYNPLIVPWIVVILMYVYMVVIAIASMMAKRLVE